jgi:hypothetical protein
MAATGAGDACHDTDTGDNEQGYNKFKDTHHYQGSPSVCTQYQGIVQASAQASTGLPQRKTKGWHVPK